MPELVRAPRKVRESTVKDAIRAALNRGGDVMLWSNTLHAGEHWDPRTGAVRWVRAGLGEGTSDLVGLVAGRFVALEVKKPGGRTAAARAEAQAQFRNLVRAKGGFAAVVHSVDEALAAVERARRGASE